MATKENRLISVTYKLYVDNNGTAELQEEATKDKPFKFITGMGISLEAFEENLLKAKEGESYEFTLTADEAYGDYFPEGVMDLPKATFEVNGKFDPSQVFEGAVVPMMDREGNRMNASVIKVTDSVVTIDLNHPLAGKALTFKGEVLESRPATNEELQQMASMLSHEGGCGGCGGCGGDCGGGCGGCGGGCSND